MLNLIRDPLFILVIRAHFSVELQEGRCHNFDAKGGGRLVGGDIGRQDWMVPFELRQGKEMDH